MRFLAYFAALIILAGCSVHKGYWPSEADAWRGKKYVDFVQKYGPPQYSQRMNERGDVMHVWNSTYYGRILTADCETKQSGQIGCNEPKRWQRSCTYTLVTAPGPDNVIRQSFLDGDCSWL